MPRLLIDPSVNRLEAICLVEAAADRVGFEHAQFEDRACDASGVQKGPGDTPSLVVGIDADTADLGADQRKEPDNTPPGVRPPVS